MLLAVSFILDPKVFYDYIISILLLDININLFFKDIVEKLNQLFFLKGLVKI